LEWLGQREGWEGIGAGGLLQRQADATDKYALLDLVQDYVDGLDKTRKGKATSYAVIRSFFMHNRCVLPEDRGYKIRSEKPSVVSKLSVASLVDIVKAANLRDRSILLVKWQSLQDAARLVYIDRHCGEELARAVRRDESPVRLDFPGQKNNDQGYYTFIGRDSIDSLKMYFENERGYPRKGETVWRSKEGKGLTRNMVNGLWENLLRRIGLIPPTRGNSPGTRYGYFAHDMRDVAKSLLHTHAKAEGFDMDCCEFWLGHTVDALGYDKFYNDKEYVRKQYLIAERYLNMVSNPLPSEEAKKDQERIGQLERELLEVKRVLESMRTANPTPTRSSQSFR